MSIDFDTILKHIGYVLDEADMVGGYEGDLSQGFSGASDAAKWWAQMAYAETLRLLPRTGKEIGVKTDLISWVADQEQYDLPSDFQWLKDVEGAWDEDEDLRYPIEVISRPQRLYYATNYSCYIELTADSSPIQKIGFVPIPDSSKTDNIKIWYWPRGTTILTNTGDTILEALEEYEELICLKAAIKIMVKANVQVSPDQYAQEARLVGDLKANIRDLQQQHAEIAPYTNYYEYD